MSLVFMPWRLRRLDSAPARTATRRHDRHPQRRDERGETLALLVVWPVLITAILLMLVHAFIATNAQAEAELAASAGLRSAWRAAADADFGDRDDFDNPIPYTGDDPHPEVLAMADAAEEAVAATAARGSGWRWWAQDVAEVHSDWCGVPDERPGGSETGWVRVVVSGEVHGPLAALWPNRWDRVHAVAQGPALLVPPARDERSFIVPGDLPVC